MDVDSSIDRVSFVGRCSDPYELFAWMSKAHENQNWKPLPQLSGSSDGVWWVQARWQSDDGVNVSIRLRVPETAYRLSIENWRQMPDDDAAYRVEWNPNKASAIGPMLFAESPRATRVDVALDYDGMDLDDWYFERPRCRSSQYFDAKSGTEGVMLGRMGSSRFLVVYDKAAELKVERDDPLARFEFRQRIRPEESPLGPDLFSGVGAFRREIPRSLDPHEAGMVALKLMAPEIFARMDRRTRRRYEGLMSDRCGRLAPDPEQVYRASRDELREMLDELANAKDVRIASVYKGTSRPGVTSLNGSGAKEAPSSLSYPGQGGTSLEPLEAVS